VAHCEQLLHEGKCDGDACEALRATFRPEFLNRVDDIVMFKALTLEQIGKIVELKLAEARERLAGRKVTLEVTSAAVNRIALMGYDPVSGARPLKRVIAREVVDRVASAIVAGTVTEGSTVEVDVEGDELVVR
jgi:ATP-dependent Clp protease ATP-binding subunit ClpB